MNMHEIERKFLLRRGAALVEADAQANGSLRSSSLIEQRYLPATGDWTVRMRKTTDLDGGSETYVMTLKRRVSNATCVEIETPIDVETHARLAANAGATIRKRRSCIAFDGHVWEVDTFLNPELEGLEIAEIELDSEDEAFSTPSWIGAEVTHKKRYKNARLVNLISEAQD